MAKTAKSLSDIAAARDRKTQMQRDRRAAAKGVARQFVTGAEPAPIPSAEPEPLVTNPTPSTRIVKGGKADATADAKETLGDTPFMVRRNARGEWYWQVIDAGLQPRERTRPERKASKADPTPKPAKVAKVKTAKAAKGERKPGPLVVILIDMLKRKTGATLEEISAKTAWQGHTARARITSDLRDLGYKVERTKSGPRGSVYRIVGEPSRASA